MYERILVPLDGSHIGEAALVHVEELVARLSPKTKVEVTLLQVISSLYHNVPVVEASIRTPYTEQEITQIKRRARRYLDKAGEGLKNAGATVKIKVTTGSTAKEIIRVADDIKADMLAMSTHGRTGIGRWVFGSVTDKVLHAGDTPVLVVRAAKT